MNALVTGGAGFIGSHLAARLLANGHRVTVLDNLSTGNTKRISRLAVRFIEGDVRDYRMIRQALQDVDAIFHLAAVVGVPHAMTHQWDSLTTNILGTHNLLNAADAGQIPIFVASSSAIYGKVAQSPVSEEDDICLGNTHKPSWTYSYAKLAEEELALAAAHERSVCVKIGRYFNVIGPGQSAAYGMVVPRFIARALRGDPLPVYGNGTQTRTFADVEDVVNATLAMWNRAPWGSVYNIGGQQEITILELARKIIQLTHSTSEIHLIPYELAFGKGFEEPLRRRPSTAKIHTLGYTPRFSLDETIMRVVKSMTEESESELTP